MAGNEKVGAAMRILIVTGSLPPMKCGVGDYTHSLADALAEKPGMEVAVLTSKDAATSDRQDQRFEVFPVMRTWKVTELPDFIRIIRRWRPHLVHLQYPTLGYGNGALPFLIPLIAFMSGIGVVQTWHEGYRRRYIPGMLLKAIVPSDLVVVRPKYRENLLPLTRWFLRRRKLFFIKNASVFRRAHLAESEKLALRSKFLKHKARLVVFLGFIFPEKGVELLFRIANPATDHIVIAGESKSDAAYIQKLLDIAEQKPWAPNVTFTGFLAPGEAGALLTVADAVVLPFRLGGGEWNTSIHGAVTQGTFVLTTSSTRNGYDETRNVYFAEIDNVEEMRRALDRYAGVRRHASEEFDRDEWAQIASEHSSIYESRLSRNRLSARDTSTAQ
jgi:glycosyltransferase involved in cell wall biosynthesis